MSSLVQWREVGLIRPMSKDGTQPATTKCDDIHVLCLAGSGVTDAGGNWAMDLDPALCSPIATPVAVSFVATATFNPHTAEPQAPGYVTTGHVPAGTTVKLFARTWDCQCKPKPYQPFEYHVTIAN